MNTTPFKLDNSTKSVIIETSALNGQAQNVAKEVFEHLLLNWTIKIADSTEDFAILDIPYLGKVGVKYAGDRYLPSGEITTDVDSYVELSDSFKKLIGDLHDEAENVLTEMYRKKVESAAAVASEE